LCSAVGLVVGGTDPLGWGRELMSWGRSRSGLGRGEVRQEWGWSLISSTVEVKGWLATPWRLLEEFLQLFSLFFSFLFSVPKLGEEGILTP